MKAVAAEQPQLRHRQHPKTNIYLTRIDIAKSQSQQHPHISLSSSKMKESKSKQQQTASITTAAIVIDRQDPKTSQKLAKTSVNTISPSHHL